MPGPEFNPDKSTATPEARRRHGEELTAISDGLVALLKEFYGRGPTQAKSYYQDDLVVCILRGGFTRVEQTLLDAHAEASLLRDRCCGLSRALEWRRVDRVDLGQRFEASRDGLGLLTAFVGQVLKEIADCLEKGETVKLSSFGSFMVRKKGQRIGRNPKTGTEVPISPRRVMVFKPSAILKQRINGHVAGNGESKAD